MTVALVRKQCTQPVTSVLIRGTSRGQWEINLGGLGVPDMESLEEPDLNFNSTIGFVNLMEHAFLCQSSFSWLL